MPGRDGPQTLAALQQLQPRIRCCFMSGDTGGYTDKDLHEMGAAAVLCKPFRLAEISQVLLDLAGDAAATSSRLEHVPIVPIIARHRIMFGEADFSQAQLDRLRGQIGGVADRVAAKAGVHVVVSRQRHDRQNRSAHT